MAVDPGVWIGAGTIFALVGLGQVICATKLRADHWLMRVQEPGGPLNLLFRSDRGGARPEVNRNVRTSGLFFIVLGFGMAGIGAAAGLL